MIFCKIKLVSKNQVSLNYLIFLFIKAQKLNFISKSFHKKHRKKRITILKSPHVNKKAQEQFEYITFSKVLLLHSSNPMKYLSFLKHLSMQQFYDVSFVAKIFSSNKSSIKIFNPDNYTSNDFSLYKDNSLKDSNKLKYKRSKTFSMKMTKIFNIYGNLIN